MKEILCFKKTLKREDARIPENIINVVSAMMYMLLKFEMLLLADAFIIVGTPQPKACKIQNRMELEIFTVYLYLFLS